MSELVPKTALVVEDDPASKKYMSLLLKKLNCQFIVAESGEQALEMMKDRDVDIMLLDIALGPGMSGIDLGGILKQESRHSQTPMIAVSAFSKEDVNRLESFGFSDYLAKPYTINGLKEILDKYLH
ncbi:MAG: response regulator [Candidatus Marinimicrobia bacterium]|nr:response regulator [Candidatus Neomarinimicrobiota bacterium]MCF7850828.1 response regulator [Candidatus Neomarinimicrobiota bacterium]MCF7904752.1 response regulator [Candidatus Neomarinimicrobiota bacterium]